MEQGVITVYLNSVQIVVDDSATVLLDAVQAGLFDRFVESDDDFTGGSDLGLSIVKRVANHHGGRHEPVPNGGSRFTLQCSDVVRLSSDRKTDAPHTHRLIRQ